LGLGRHGASKIILAGPAHPVRAPVAQSGSQSVAPAAVES